MSEKKINQTKQQLIKSIIAADVVTIEVPGVGDVKVMKKHLLEKISSNVALAKGETCVVVVDSSKDFNIRIAGILSALPSRGPNASEQKEESKQESRTWQARFDKEVNEISNPSHC